MAQITSRRKKILEDKLPELNAKLEKATEDRQIALGYGDLRENAEYETASNVVRQTYAEIKNIEELLKDAQVVSDEGGKEIKVGSYIKVTEVDTNKNPLSEPKMLIVDSVESLFEGSIGINSPLGKKILGNTSDYYDVTSEFNVITRYYVEKLPNSVEPEFEAMYPPNPRLFGDDIE
ncbi:GreA/GreB family elongation factor [Paraclostridium bifermentans]|uniref:hypothetical protein n=1 Tax=Paraclostridium bifermentans TaxID=1490 RepID=UPI00374F6055